MFELFVQSKNHLEAEKKSYLKVTVDSAQIFKHVQLNLKGTKFTKLEFIVYVDYVYSITNSKEKVVKTIGEVRMNITNKFKSNSQGEETLEKEEDLVFEQTYQRWDCIDLTNCNPNNFPGELTIRYEITSKELENIVKSLMAMMKSRKRMEEEIKNPENKEFNSTKKLVSLPQRSGWITFPIDKIVRQAPFMINEVALDIYLKRTHRNNEGVEIEIDDNGIPPNEAEGYLESDKQKKLNQQQHEIKEERDGVINFTIVYLPEIQPEIKLRNIRLLTENFNKNYRLLVKETFREHKRQENIREMDFIEKSSSLEEEKNNNSKSLIVQNESENNLNDEYSRVIKLEATKWKEFQCVESFETPVTIPLKLHNNFDRLEFYLLMEKEDTQFIKTNNKETIESGKDKSGEKDRSNIRLGEKKGQFEFESLGKTKTTIKNRRDSEIRIKGILVENLYRESVENNEDGWSEYRMRFQEKNNKQAYELQFEYRLSMNLPMVMGGELNENQDEKLNENEAESSAEVINENEKIQPNQMINGFLQLAK